MSETIDRRVTRLEVRVEAQEKELGVVQKMTEALNEALTNIQDNLTQIKWLALGVAITMAVNYLGFPKAVEMVVHHVLG